MKKVSNKLEEVDTFDILGQEKKIHRKPTNKFEEAEQIEIFGRDKPNKKESNKFENVEHLEIVGREKVTKRPTNKLEDAQQLEIHGKTKKEIKRPTNKFEDVAHFDIEGNRKEADSCTNQAIEQIDFSDQKLECFDEIQYDDVEIPSHGIRRSLTKVIDRSRTKTGLSPREGDSIFRRFSAANITSTVQEVRRFNIDDEKLSSEVTEKDESSSIKSPVPIRRIASQIKTSKLPHYDINEDANQLRFSKSISRHLSLKEIKEKKEDVRDEFYLANTIGRVLSGYLADQIQTQKLEFLEKLIIIYNYNKELKKKLQVKLFFGRMKLIKENKLLRKKANDFHSKIQNKTKLQSFKELRRFKEKRLAWYSKIVEVFEKRRLK